MTISAGPPEGATEGFASPSEIGHDPPTPEPHRRPLPVGTPREGRRSGLLRTSAGRESDAIPGTCLLRPRGRRGSRIADPDRRQPPVLIFVHEITRPALQLIRPIDHFGAKWADQGLATRIVWLAANPVEAEAFLTRARGSLRFKSPVVISLDGAEGPGNYGLNRKATLTILVAKDDKVVANFAIVQPNETDALAPGRGREAGGSARRQSPKSRRGRAGPDDPAGVAASSVTAGWCKPAGHCGRITALEEQVAALTKALEECGPGSSSWKGTDPHRST